MNPAATAEPVEDVHGDGRWMCMHQRFIAEAKEREPEVLFIGDSIMQQLQYHDMWENMFVPLHCLNFGIGGDRTEHILWRLQNGELENLSPKIVVVCGGTNNHGHTAEQISEGLCEIVRTIQEKQAQAFVIVMAIPPRGQWDNPVRTKLAMVNELVSQKLENMSNVRFLNIDWSLFISSEDSRISHKDMIDYLHFTKKGYQKLCEPLLDEIQTYLKNFIKADSASCGDPDQ